LFKLSAHLAEARWTKLLIKETNTQAAKPELVTHNSIFAD